ncbi:hypothetical protein Tco_0684315 [Tanacetum coccineum]
MLNLRNSNQDPPVDLYYTKGSYDYTNVPFDNEQILRQHNIAQVTLLAYTPSLPFLTIMELVDTLLMGDEVISTTPERENDEFIKSSVDDLVPILRESEVTSVCDDLECDMPVNTSLPTTDNMDVAGLPRHLVKRLFDLLVKSQSSTKRISDEPLGDDSKPRSYDVTFSNPLFDFNDDFTLCNDNLLFDEEFKDIGSLDPPELTPVINESTLLVTLPLPCTVVLGDAIIDIDLLLGEHLDTLSMRDREIDFNPSNSDSMSRSSETSDLFEELIAEFSLNDSIPTEIDDRYHDSEGDILYFEQLLNEDTSSNISPTFLPIESSSLDLPLSDPKQICLRIFYDLEDLRACFQSFNHAVSDHFHDYILEILNPDHIYI